jgi:chromosome segregation ATPase
MKEQKEALQAAMALLREQVASDKTRIEFMETTIAAGGDNSKALTEEVKRLESARQLERDSREACERELHTLRGQFVDARARLELADVELKYAHDASLSCGDSSRKLGDEVKRLELSVHTLSLELEKSRASQMQLETRLATEEEKKAALNAQLAEMAAQLASSQSHQQLLQGILSDCNQRSAADKARIELMEVWESCTRSETSRANLEKILEGAVDETDRLRTALMEAEAQKEASVFKARDLEAQNALFSKQVHSLHQELQSREVGSVQCKCRIVELEAQVDQITMLMQEVFSAIRFQQKAPASPSSPSPAADLLMTAHAKLVSENAALKAHVQASQRGLDGSAARLAELEALNDDLRALTNSLQIRLEKASDDLAEAKAENKRLMSLIQEADHAGFELERQAILLTESQQKVRNQEDRIAQLLAEIKELKTQVKYLTKQLEMAVEDLETEARQTERFTNTFIDWSQRFNDVNCDSNESVEHTRASQSAQHSFC